MTGTTADPGPSAGQILEEVTRIAFAISGVTPPPEAGLIASGLDSGHMVALLTEVNDRWQLDISVDALFDGGNLQSLAKHVENALRAAPVEPDARPMPGPTGRGAEDRRTVRDRIRSAIGSADA